MSCAVGDCLTNSVYVSQDESSHHKQRSHGASDRLRMAKSLSGLNLPRFAHRRGKGKISRLKQAKGGRTPDTLSAVDGEGSVSAAPTPFS